MIPREQNQEWRQGSDPFIKELASEITSSNYEYLLKLILRLNFRLSVVKLKPQLALLNFRSGVVDKILLSMKSTGRRFENMEGLN